MMRFFHIGTHFKLYSGCRAWMIRDDAIMKNTIFNIFTLLGLLVLPMSSVAQTEIGECSVEPVEDGSFFQMNGNNYELVDLPISLQQAMYDAELKFYKEQLAIIDQAILVKEIERLADESDKPFEDMFQQLFIADTPSDSAVSDFYAQNRDQINAPLNVVKGQIIQAMMQMERQDRQIKMLNDLKQKGEFKINLPKPTAPHAELAVEGFPSKGADNPAVTIVEFADYQCPHCKFAAGVLSDMLLRYPNDLSIVYVDFPINSSGVSRLVAEGAVCAGEQGKFWEYHDQAFVDQEKLDKSAPTNIATTIGLNIDTFQACLTSPNPANHVKRGEGEAVRLGLSSTPTLFLNGRRLHMHDMASELPAEIEAHLNHEG